MSEPQEITSETQSQNAGDNEILQLVSFEIGAEEYAIPILAVQEINRMMPITCVPHSPPAVEGVINLRGRIIPVIDMRKRFGMEASADTSDARIIVVEVGQEGRVLGFTVDRVHEVLRLDKSIVDPAPTMSGACDADFVKGVGKLEDRLLILIDLDRLFSDIDFVESEGSAKAA